MRRRIFIAINFPENLKEKIFSWQKELEDLFQQASDQETRIVRWTKRDNLHVTLIFIGFLTDQETGQVCFLAKEAALRHPSFSLNFNKISYGPPGKIPPRLVWLQGEKEKELLLLKEDLEKSLREEGIRFESEKEFRPHITLGRIKSWQWKKIDPETRPKTEKEVSLSFQVGSLEVMESKLKPRGPEYLVLESASLGKK